MSSPYTVLYAKCTMGMRTEYDTSIMKFSIVIGIIEL